MVSMHRRLLDVPPATGNRTHDAYVSETNFDTNMVIILAALLCALIGALGLNSIVRCLLRCSSRFALETAEETAARLAATGLKKRDLRQIPVAVYGAGGSIAATECPICLGEFVDGEKVRVLPICGHGFHVRCIDTWLLSHSSCPNCRHSLLEHATDSGAAREVPEATRPGENSPRR
ncbi:RING-H2 FINGER PROTEIN ATL61-RELATED-RELATED [Salix purpurea]|uniref:RING-type E3 ubiquitin transferase n=1 Tax=Salix purpurea TaxID=77065 RepID=A0A9Q1ABH1_SALPP|nr:RING-H2 FINGER PROTEIN ATL61-RELATED-RELATED [Salix purpurea]